MCFQHCVYPRLQSASQHSTLCLNRKGAVIVTFSSLSVFPYQDALWCLSLWPQWCTWEQRHTPSWSSGREQCSSRCLPCSRSLAGMCWTLHRPRCTGPPNILKKVKINFKDEKVTQTCIKLFSLVLAYWHIDQTISSDFKSLMCVVKIFAPQNTTKTPNLWILLAMVNPSLVYKYHIQAIFGGNFIWL